MPEIFVSIRLVIIELELTGITGDQPGREIVIPSRKVMIAEFAAIIYPIKVIMPLRPGGKITVYRLEIGKGEDIPSFFYIDGDIGSITPKTLEIDNNFIKEMRIDEPVVG